MRLDVQFALTGAEELRGYKDRADNYMCNVLPRSVSPTSQTSVTPGIVTRSSFFWPEENYIEPDKYLCIYHFSSEADGIV